jgi:hypothetical protein
MAPENFSSPDDKHRMDFILNTELPKPKTWREKLRSPAGIVLLLIATLVLAVVIAIPIVVSKQNNQAQIDKLAAVHQAQKKVVSFSQFIQQKAESASMVARAQTVENAINKQSSAVQMELIKRGASEAVISAPPTESSQSQADRAIGEAFRNDNLDQAFGKLLDEQLIEYQRLLLAAQNGSSEAERLDLEKAYQDVNKLLGLVDSESSQPADGTDEQDL